MAALFPNIHTVLWDGLTRSTNLSAEELMTFWQMEASQGRAKAELVQTRVHSDLTTWLWNSMCCNMGRGETRRVLEVTKNKVRMPGHEHCIKSRPVYWRNVSQMNGTPFSLLQRATCSLSGALVNILCLFFWTVQLAQYLLHWKNVSCMDSITAHNKKFAVSER